MPVTTERKPFHESIVDAIKGTTHSDHLFVLGELIEKTKIPKGHDDIYQAFKEKSKELGVEGSDNFTRVIHSLAEQGEEAKEKDEGDGTKA